MSFKVKIYSEILEAMKAQFEGLLTLYDEETDVKNINVQAACPKCDVKWVETKGFSNVYYDCPVCGKKKEDTVR